MVPLAAGPAGGPADGMPASVAVGRLGDGMLLSELLDDSWGAAAAPTAKRTVLENFILSASDCVML